MIGDGQAFPKYPKQQGCNIFAISERKKGKNEVGFSLADKNQRFLQIYTIILGCVARHAQIIQSNKFAICNILRKKGVMRLIFCIQKVFYKLILWFLMGMVKHSQSYQNSRFAMSLQYLKKMLEMKLIFCMQINIRVSYKLI